MFYRKRGGVAVKWRSFFTKVIMFKDDFRSADKQMDAGTICSMFLVGSVVCKCGQYPRSGMLALN